MVGRTVYIATHINCTLIFSFLCLFLENFMHPQFLHEYGCFCHLSIRISYWTRIMPVRCNGNKLIPNTNSSLLPWATLVSRDVVPTPESCREPRVTKFIVISQHHYHLPPTIHCAHLLQVAFFWAEVWAIWSKFSL